ENMELTPWLAESMPVFDEESLTYTVRLRDAKWSDGTPFTAEDVAFTVKVIKDFKDRSYYKWKFVKEVEVVDDRTVRFHLEEPMAIFRERTLTTPIVQKKQWLPIVEEALKTEKPLAALRNHQIDRPVGTGPFVLEEWKKGAYVFMKTNEHFFGKGLEIAGRKLGPYIDGIIFKVFGTSDAAILALKKGDVDMFWWRIQPGYIEELEADEEIKLFTNERSALYYLGFNLRRPPFDNVALRRAIAFLIDRNFIMLRVLQGYGTMMTSIVPPGNTFWHCPDVPEYADKVLLRGERIQKAYEILEEAGFTWAKPPVNDKGEVQDGKGIRLPDGTPMADFTILTPPADYDPARAMAGVMIQEWLRAAGLPASAKPMAFGSLLDQVKGRHDFDMFVLGYGSLNLDPNYLKSFFHSENDKPRGWNMSGYHNPRYDDLADKSARTMDPDERRNLIYEMQRILMHDIPYLPLYNPHLIEAVRTDDFEGWVPMLEGIGNTWSFCNLKPK
ncbi:MAG: ABC transporter substrate-binding protein, partial [Deltaproteobacteria bacterium]|nr:ABC transporter substrate-binding protein [Deltaproteobacteria bacterium]